MFRKGKVTKAGKRLAWLMIITQFYERKTFPGWPYNLFAMLHAQNMGQVEQVVSRFVKAEKLNSFCLLPTVTELKKRSIRH